MIDLALQRLGKQRCPECNKTQDYENNYCVKCNHCFNKKSNRSTPEDNL